MVVVTGQTLKTAMSAGSLLRAQLYFNQLYPDELHGTGGDCINPKCNYEFTTGDIESMEENSGWFSCPNCGWTYNYLNDTDPDTRGGYTRAGLTPSQMGSIGERIVEEMHVIPTVGTVSQTFTQFVNFPIDAVIGPYGVEIKTNHSEAQPRFKIGGEWVVDPDTGKKMPARQGKLLYCQRNGLMPGLLGVRLNFYTDKADLFFRPAFSDTWIGNPALTHVATYDFTNLNPFKDPADVPSPDQLPEDSDDGIPF